MTKTKAPFKDDTHRIFDDGTAQRKVVLALVKKGYTDDRIAAATGLTVTEVKKIRS
jgi:transcription initiation factor IIE alpha subunit